MNHVIVNRCRELIGMNDRIHDGLRIDLACRRLDRHKLLGRIHQGRTAHAAEHRPFLRGTDRNQVVLGNLDRIDGMPAMLIDLVTRKRNTLATTSR